jgi:HD-like signal output (HDOD) protein
VTPSLRVLFVDDEPNVLQGLGRLLRPMRSEWHMEFAPNAAAALEILALGPFDAVVTDMRMPGMDGAALLEEVKRRHPHLVRIVLSGQADQASVVRSLDSTHQYLSKPCDPDTLKQTLVRACAVRMLLADDALKRVVSQLGSLPTLPATYVLLLQECRASDGSVLKVADAISQDMAMTAKVLQMANSAFFGRRRRVSDPLQAVQFLGLNTVKALVLSAYAFGEYEKRVSTPRFSFERLQAHSVMTGACARIIAAAERAPDAMRDDASVAALLHDIGELILAATLPAEYGRALDLAAAREIPIPDAEMEVFGATHAEVGAYLLGLWNLPDPVVEAVAYHHAPRRCVTRQWSALTLIHVADSLASELEKSGAVPAHTDLDAEYDPEGSFEARLPVWRRLCEAEMTEHSQ